ncbi:MAG: phosphatase PAP2 family protein [Alphaproteobacteria bacterium]|nr:phosphatase PAP2 family protein [Alphaproteobacteria bacterium]
MTAPNFKTLGAALLAALGLCALLFLFNPGLDLAVSSAFYRETDGFWLENESLLSTYRNSFNITSMSLAVVSLILWIVCYWRGPVFGVYDRVWAFITLLYVLGPGLLVNGLLKSYVGRARPADVTEFGGENAFTGALRIANECQSNCSFVSGEGSSATAFFISILALSPFVSNKAMRYLLVTIGFCAALTAATLRVLKGRHFLSDTVFSVLFVSLVAIILAWLLLRRKKAG